MVDLDVPEREAQELAERLRSAREGLTALSGSAGCLSAAAAGMPGSQIEAAAQAAGQRVDLSIAECTRQLQRDELELSDITGRALASGAP